MKQTGVEDNGTETTGVEDHKPSHNTEPEYDDKKPQRSNRIRFQNQEVEQINEDLKGTFGDLEPCSPEEIIVWINAPNERQNYYNTMEFIANEARRDQMIDGYILTQYSLKAGQRKFGQDGRKATMKELQHNIIIKSNLTSRGKLT